MGVAQDVIHCLKWSTDHQRLFCKFDNDKETGLSQLLGLLLGTGKIAEWQNAREQNATILLRNLEQTEQHFRLGNKNCYHPGTLLTWEILYIIIIIIFIEGAQLAKAVFSGALITDQMILLNIYKTTPPQNI